MSKLYVMYEEDIYEPQSTNILIVTDKLTIEYYEMNPAGSERLYLEEWDNGAMILRKEKIKGSWEVQYDREKELELKREELQEELDRVTEELKNICEGG